MSRLIGDRMPAPLRFDFGAPAMPGDVSRGVLLASVDADGSVRMAVLSTDEITAPDDRTLRVALRADSATCKNVASRADLSVWCVLDAAAYTVKGRAHMAADQLEPGKLLFDVEVTSVWCDFQEHAPMVSGPTYRAPIEKA